MERKFLVKIKDEDIERLRQNLKDNYRDDIEGCNRLDDNVYVIKSSLRVLEVYGDKQLKLYTKFHIVEVKEDG